MDICEYTACLPKVVRHPWEIARSRFIADLVGDYFLREEGQVRLLDFGCGDGFVTRTLASRYATCHLVGVDHKIDAVCRQGECEQDTEHIKYLGSLEEFQGENGSLDGGLLLDVLEHITDDESFLGGFLGNKVFTEHARFIITCPAFEVLFSNHDSLLGHCRRYSLPELKDKVERAGGILLESGYIFVIPLYFRIVEVLLEKMSFLNCRERTHISAWRGARVTTSITSWMLYFDALICRSLRRFSMVGLTCYIICRKRAS